MSVYQLMIEDLHRHEPTTPYVSPPLYQSTDTPTDKVQKLSLQLRRAKSMNNRAEMLLVSYYIGQLLETLEPSDRTRSLRFLTLYHQCVAVKVYYIFELLGPEQIPRTEYMSLARIDKLKHSDYEALVNDAATIAGTRL
jgi:hypothetical protein